MDRANHDLVVSGKSVCTPSEITSFRIVRDRAVDYSDTTRAIEEIIRIRAKVRIRASKFENVICREWNGYQLSHASVW